VNEVVRALYRAAVWFAATVVLLSSLAAILGTASAATTTYTLTGYVDQPTGLSGPPVPAGVTVDLTSRATGQVFTTTTGAGGEFTFTTSSTSGALVPGYWGLSVPPLGNVSLTGCKPCGILPENQNPVWNTYNVTDLTNANYSTVLTNVSVHLYNATLNGTVTQNSGAVEGALVRLLDPDYNGFALANNTTNATGFFSLKVPYGSWVLSVTHTSGSTTYSNTSSITISKPVPTPVTPVLRSYFLSGRMETSTGYVPTAGNATLYDPTNGYIYSVATPPGGYYSFPTYPAGFNTSGAQTFDVILAAIGYQTTWFTQSVKNTTPISVSKTLKTVTESSLGLVDTTLNFADVNVTSGTGTLSVKTAASLGNETVLPGLPNDTVGQLWAQLGLDFNHSLSVPAAEVTGAFKTWLLDQGPFFPAVQAGMAINGTKFLAPTVQPSPTFSTLCSGYCGLSSSANVSYAWSTNYTLNGTIPKNASSYSISFGFAHPTTSAELFNYTIVLPAGYVLAAGTTAPAHSDLVGSGPNGTWTEFTLESKPTTTASATATFTIDKLASVEANVSATVANSTFSSANILNSTHGNYTVVVGVGQNVTFSAANSTYLAGTNGTQFVWNFGDGSPKFTTDNATTNHTYTTATVGTTPDTGTLTITSSGGKTNDTSFYVYVMASTPAPTAVITSNATSAETKIAGTTTYLFVNWSTTLHFNASLSTLAGENVWSIAQFHLHAKDYNQSANYSVAAGAKFAANWTLQFNGAGAYLLDGNVSGTSVPLMGWQYNMTLTVWTGTGSSASTSLVILVVDTEPPIPAFSILTLGGTLVSGSGITEAANETATIRLDAANTTAPSNGTISNYYWKITNDNNSSRAQYKNVTAVKPGGVYPTFTLDPESAAYTINLTVTDLNGIKANTTKPLTVSPNATTRPILQAENLTGLGTVTAGKSTTYWVNVTVGGGTKAFAKNLNVTFYLLSASGTGSRRYIAGTPGSVQFYGYYGNGTVNSTLLASGTIGSLAYNKTVRAVVTWTPGVTGNFILYANATASNEFPASEVNNVVSMPITVHPNPTTEAIEYGGIAAAVLVVIGVLVWWYRKPRRPAGQKPSSSSRSGLERGSRSSADEDDDS
jgi:hypothetical protein